MKWQTTQYCFFFLNFKNKERCSAVFLKWTINIINIIEREGGFYISIFNKGVYWSTDIFWKSTWSFHKIEDPIRTTPNTIMIVCLYPANTNNEINTEKITKPICVFQLSLGATHSKIDYFPIYCRPYIILDSFRLLVIPYSLFKWVN